MPPGTSAYPAGLDTQDTLIRAKDGVQSTLSAAIDAVTGTIPLASAATFPATGVAVIEGEEIIYAGITGNDLTGGIRGALSGDGGGAAAPHAAAVPVRLVAIAATHRVQNDAIIGLETKLGTGASTPAAGQFLKGTGAGASGWSALASGDVTTALGFTPANRAGDTLTGALAIDDGAGDPAASGALRLRNLGTIGARNAAGTADISVIALDEFNRVSLRGSEVTIAAGGAIVAGSLSVSGGVGANGLVTAAGAVLGITPAAAGLVRLPNAGWVAARNAANTADVNLIRAGTGNAVELGGAATVAGSLTADGNVASVRSGAAAYLVTDAPYANESMHYVYAGGALRWTVGRPASSDNWRLTSAGFGTAVEVAYLTGAITAPQLAGTGRRLLSVSAAGLLQAGSITTDGSSIFASGTYNASALAGSSTRMATINTFGDLNAASGITTTGTNLTVSGLGGTGSRLVYAGSGGALTAAGGLTTDGASLFITGAGTINAASIAGTGDRLLRASQYGDVQSAGITVVGTASVTWDPATVAWDDPETVAVTVTGAQPGDFVLAGLTTMTSDYDLSIGITAYVRATNTVVVTIFHTKSIQTVNSNSGTLNVLVLRI